MSIEKTPFETKPDSGNLFAEGSKKNPLSPDYSGTISVNLKDLTGLKTENGLTVIKLSGWKQVSKTNGKTYLSLKVNRFVSKEQGGRYENQVSDDEVPF